MSIRLYKMFVENLLLELENAAIGFHLGNIYVGTPTSATSTGIVLRSISEHSIMDTRIAYAG